MAARIEMVEPVAAFGERQPQGAEPIPIARDHDDLSVLAAQLACQARLLHAHQKIDEKIKQFRG